MVEIRLEMHLAAPIEHVFEGLADHANYDRFRPIGTSELLREGSEERNGTGAVRRLAAKGMSFDEEITAFERPTRIDYLIVKVNLPLAHEGGSIRLAPAGNGTDVLWTSRARITVPVLGRVLETPSAAFFRRGFRQMLEDIEALYSGEGGIRTHEAAFTAHAISSRAP